jgi:hypothetical protein
MGNRKSKHKYKQNLSFYCSNFPDFRLGFPDFWFLSGIFFTFCLTIFVMNWILIWCQHWLFKHRFSLIDEVWCQNSSNWCIFTLFDTILVCLSVLISSIMKTQRSWIQGKLKIQTAIPEIQTKKVFVWISRPKNLGNLNKKPGNLYSMQKSWKSKQKFLFNFCLDFGFFVYFAAIFILDFLDICEFMTSVVNWFQLVLTVIFLLFAIFVVKNYIFYRFFLRFQIKWS